MGDLRKEAFELTEYSYSDKYLGIDIKLHIKGYMDIESVEDEEKLSEIKEESIGLFKKELEELSSQECTYDMIPRQDWNSKGFQILELYPLDDYYPAIIKAKKAVAEAEAERSRQEAEAEAERVRQEAAAEAERARQAAEAEQLKRQEEYRAAMEARKLFCAKCGSDMSNLGADVKFCAVCGAPLVVPTPTGDSGTGPLRGPATNYGTGPLTGPSARYGTGPLAGPAPNYGTGPLTGTAGNTYVSPNMGVQETQIAQGRCNWIVTPVLIQGGNALLTDKRFVYKKGSLLSAPLLVTTVISKVGSQNEFEIPLENIIRVSMGTQGLGRTIIIHTLEKSYTLNFMNCTDLFWNAFTGVLKIPS